MSIQERIQDLKREKNAVILAHNYQLPEIQDVADYVGDSLELSKIAARVEEGLIVFCGVRFMAETAKILSPGKKVIAPEYAAICPMAKMIDGETVIDMREEYPDAVFVAYINTTSDVKAEVDLCVTSANAVRIVSELPADKEIVFLPDKNLGKYVRQETGRTIHIFSGFCPTHNRMLKEDIILAREKWPNALVVSHPECIPEVIELSNHIASTSGMLKFARESHAKEFIIATEQGMLHRLKKENPGKKFYSPSALNICPNMKKTTIAKLLHALETEKSEVDVPEDIRKRAIKTIEYMLVG
ncbi:quinolinate synthase NadA [bacterium]|nr:quinolinate synthase NadA [bacterium]